MAVNLRTRDTLTGVESRATPTPRPSLSLKETVTVPVGSTRRILMPTWAPISMQCQTQMTDLLWSQPDDYRFQIPFFGQLAFSSILGVSRLTPGSVIPNWPWTSLARKKARKNPSCLRTEVENTPWTTGKAHLRVLYVKSKSTHLRVSIPETTKRTHVCPVQIHRRSQRDQNSTAVRLLHL